MVINHNMPSLNQHRIMKTNVKTQRIRPENYHQAIGSMRMQTMPQGSASQRRCVIRSEDLTVHHPMCRMVSV